MESRATRQAGQYHHEEGPSPLRNSSRLRQSGHEREFSCSSSIAGGTRFTYEAAASLTDASRIQTQGTSDATNLVRGDRNCALRRTPRRVRQRTHVPLIVRCLGPLDNEPILPRRHATVRLR